MRFSLKPGSCAVLAIGLGLIAPLLFAQSKEQRYPVTASQVASTLVGSGLEVSAAQIEMPLFLNAGSPAPKLRLSAAESLPSGSLRVRITCEQTKECLSFFATIHGVEDRSVDMAALRLADSRTTSAPSLGPLLQAGRQATLLMENQYMHITLPVIAIDSGRPGTEVRVSSLDRKQTFRGVVTDGQTVRGTLP